MEVVAVPPDKAFGVAVAALPDWACAMTATGTHKASAVTSAPTPNGTRTR
jgi:hypothetical protein